MQNILRTNDPVLLSFVEALLREAAISHHVADAHISILEGSIGAFPRRVLVANDDVAAAQRLIADAGLAAELLPLRAPAAGDASPRGEQAPPNPRPDPLADPLADPVPDPRPDLCR